MAERPSVPAAAAALVSGFGSFRPPPAAAAQPAPSFSYAPTGDARVKHSSSADKKRRKDDYDDDDDDDRGRRHRRRSPSRRDASPHSSRSKRDKYERYERYDRHERHDRHDRHERVNAGRDVGRDVKGDARHLTLFSAPDARDMHYARHPFALGVPRGMRLRFVAEGFHASELPRHEGVSEAPARFMDVPTAREKRKPRSTFSTVAALFGRSAVAAALKATGGRMPSRASSAMGALPDYVAVDLDAKGDKKDDDDDTNDDAWRGFAPSRPSLPREQEAASVGEDYYTAETARLNARLRLSPDDASLWISLVALQEEAAVRAGAALWERQLAILDKARAALPRDERIAAARMRLCQLLWEADAPRVLNEWDAVLSDFPSSFSLAVAYIDFRSSHFATLSVDACVRICQQWLRRMEASRDAATDPLVHEEHMVYFIVRAARLLADAGHTERSYCVLQCCVEFAVLYPPSCADDKERRLAAFAAFFASNAPRIGDPGGRGWRAMVGDDAATTGVIHEEDAAADVIDAAEVGVVVHEDDVLWTAWRRTERHRSRLLWLPWRRMDWPARKEEEEEEEAPPLVDPDRVVVFDDVCGFLVELRTAAARQQLVLFLVEHLGVRSMPFFLSTNDARMADAHIGWRAASYEDNDDEDDDEEKEEAKEGKEEEEIKPMNAPMNAPLDAPLDVPMHPPMRPPMNAPMDAPMHPPMDAPMDAPMGAPMHPPMHPPMDAPMDPPMDAPMGAPMSTSAGPLLTPATSMPSSAMNISSSAASSAPSAPHGHVTHSLLAPLLAPVDSVVLGVGAAEAWESDRVMLPDDDTALRPNARRFVRRVLSAVGAVEDDARTALVSLAVEERCASAPDSITAMARAAMGAHRTSAVLCDAFCRLMVLGGRVEDALRMYHMALSGAGGAARSVLEGEDAAVLARGVVEAELMRTGRTQRAMRILVGLADGEYDAKADYRLSAAVPQVSPALLLRARVTLKRRLRERPAMNFHFLLCVAWLEWMAAGAQAACDVCVYVVENDIVLKEFDLERFFEGWIRLLRFAATQGEVAPRLLFDALSRSVSRFPNNQYFWWLFSSLHRGHLFRFAVRRRLASALSSPLFPSTAPLWHAALASQVGDAQGDVAMARAWFERAVGDMGVRACASIWVAYARWEMALGAHARAKDVVLRGIRECPAHKSVYMLMFDLPAGVVTADELRDVFEMMEDKGIRLRTVPEEIEHVTREMDEMAARDMDD